MPLGFFGGDILVSLHLVHRGTASGGYIVTNKLIMLGVASGVFALVPAFAGPPPVDNTNGTVSCGTILKASAKPKPTLTNAGGVPTVVFIKGTLGGCSSGDTAVSFPEGKSKFKGTINAADNGCAGLAGPSSGTGTVRRQSIVDHVGV
jgi:hypothetical protein